MDLITSTSDADVTHDLFTLGETTGALWRAMDASAPSGALVLVGHGGGQHRNHPSVLARARRCVELGFVAACLDAPGHGDRPLSDDDLRFTTDLRERMSRGEPVGPVIGPWNVSLATRAAPEWQALLDTLTADGVIADDARVGYWGVSLGGAIGVVLAAAEPRIVAAVLGLVGHPQLLDPASRVNAAVEFEMQWDDEHVTREDALALYDAFASAEKSLHVNPGRHGDVPVFERDSAQRFLVRHLTPG